MLARCVIIVWAMAVTLLPVAPAPAAEGAHGTQSPANDDFLPHPTPAPASAVTMQTAPLHSTPARLIYKLDAPAPESRPDGLRFDFARNPVPEPSLRLAPGASASRTGWALSGRAAFVRWLTPIDGEGGTTVRLSGRIVDQPRAPGLGVFNLSLHYTFE